MSSKTTNMVAKRPRYLPHRRWKVFQSDWTVALALVCDERRAHLYAVRSDRGPKMWPAKAHERAQNTENATLPFPATQREQLVA